MQTIYSLSTCADPGKIKNQRYTPSSGDITLAIVFATAGDDLTRMGVILLGWQAAPIEVWHLSVKYISLIMYMFTLLLCVDH